MKFRRLAGAAAAAGVIAIGTGVAPAAAAGRPYPPVPCSGNTGTGTVTSTIVTQGGTVSFTACGFQSGTIIIIILNGKTITTLIALLNGSVTVPLHLNQLGHNSIRAVGRNRDHARAHQVRRAGYRGAFNRPADFSATSDTRIVDAGVDVVRRGAAVTGALPAARPASVVGHDGGLPLSGVEAGILGASALAFAGGGVGLRLAARRRQSAGGGPSGRG